MSPARFRSPSGRFRLAGAVLAVAACIALSACTPTQFQAWWTNRGNAPLQEPQLSKSADAATRYWDEVFRIKRFAYSATRIDAALAARMTPSSWRPGCPVPLSSLRYVRLSYMGFDGGEHTGEIVLNADAVIPAIGLFQTMWEQRFPLERLQLVDDYGGSDDASMAANNTSAFNCRPATGSTSWSQHAFGRAIDINPVQNPYVTSGPVQPAAGAAYVDRSNVRPGMIVPGDAITRAVRFIGWGWGGSWASLKDYMHVSANGS
jgi:hypothetical protein